MMHSDLIFQYDNPDMDIYIIPAKNVIVIEVDGKQLLYAREKAEEIVVKILVEVAKLRSTNRDS